MRFRDEYQAVLLDWVTRTRRFATGKADLELEVLSLPCRDSPFLTLAERAETVPPGLPWRVLKLLLVLEEDPSEPFWKQILQQEYERWREELQKRLTLPRRVELLHLPLSAPENGPDDLVELSEIGPLRRGDVLAGAQSEGMVRFAYLARPFIAWPRLRDVGYSADQLRELWEIYCGEHGIEARLHDLLFDHFCNEALTSGRGDLLLTSAWRLEISR